MKMLKIWTEEQRASNTEKQRGVEVWRILALVPGLRSLRQTIQVRANLKDGWTDRRTNVFTSKSDFSRVPSSEERSRQADVFLKKFLCFYSTNANLLILVPVKSLDLSLNSMVLLYLFFVLLLLFSIL